MSFVAFWACENDMYRPIWKGNILKIIYLNLTNLFFFLLFSFYSITLYSSLETKSCVYFNFDLICVFYFHIFFLVSFIYILINWVRNNFGCIEKLKWILMSWLLYTSFFCSIIFAHTTHNWWLAVELVRIILVQKNVESINFPVIIVTV